jgi:hypothetical protein
MVEGEKGLPSESRKFSTISFSTSVFFALINGFVFFAPFFAFFCPFASAGEVDHPTPV